MRETPICASKHVIPYDIKTPQNIPAANYVYMPTTQHLFSNACVLF